MNSDPCFPHAREGACAEYNLELAKHMFPAHAGVNPTHAYDGCSTLLIPAYAGVALKLRFAQKKKISVSRTRGGGPGRKFPQGKAASCYSHVRGWAREELHVSR